MRQILLFPLLSIFCILCSCEFESSTGIVTYTFLEVNDKITIIQNENVQTITNDTNLKMSFEADLLKNESLKFESTELSITTEHNIQEWNFHAINNVGFEFVGVGYE